MPAVSKAQRRNAAMCLHARDKVRNKGMCKMKPAELRKFARTKEKGLVARKRS